MSCCRELHAFVSFCLSACKALNCNGKKTIGCHQKRVPFPGQEHSRRRCGGRDEGSEAGQEFDLKDMDRLWIGILWQFNKE